MLVWSAEDPDYPRVAAGGIKPTNLSKELQFFEKVSHSTLHTYALTSVHACISISLCNCLWNKCGMSLHTAFHCRAHLSVKPYIATLPQHQCSAGDAISWGISKAAVWRR